IVFRPFQVLGIAFPDGLRRILDVPAYWFLLLPIEFPAVYVTGAVSLWAYLRLRDPDGGGDEKKQAAKTFALLAAASLVCGGLFVQTPEMWAAVRRHAAPDERVANNPLFLQDLTPWPVNLSWALLSDRRSCFAGRELTLAYTALPRARREEIDAQFMRVFAG